MTDLQAVARVTASYLADADKKHLRFNEIVDVAQEFYPANPEEGVRDLVMACDRTSPMYVKGRPMWQGLREQYSWMLA